MKKFRERDLISSAKAGFDINNYKEKKKKKHCTWLALIIILNVTFSLCGIILKHYDFF